MICDKIAVRVAKWLDGFGTNASDALERQGYFQENAERMFPEIRWADASAANLTTAIAVNKALALALAQRRVAAISMLVFTLTPASSDALFSRQIVLSREIDADHPPLFYVFADRSRFFAPLGVELRFPLLCRDISADDGYCFLLARPSEFIQSGYPLSQDWDRDIRIVLPANCVPAINDYDSKSLATLTL